MSKNKDDGKVIDKTSPKQPDENHDYGVNGEKLPEGITFQMLQSNWDTCRTQYTKIRKRMLLLDSVDKGKVWEKICKKFPQYQIAPDSNHVNYIKENILASIYTVGKSASLIPKRPEDEQIVKDINTVLDSIWDILSVPMYQQKAGERAALLNLGITQVGWNQDLVGGTQDAWYKGDVVFKNIDPMNYFRDPYSSTLDDSAYVIQFEDHNIVNLKANPNYNERMKDYCNGRNFDIGEDLIQYDTNRVSHTNASDEKSVRLIIHWIKVVDENMSEGYKIHEIHTINNSFCLYVKEDIKPAMFPFAELYCNEPGNELVGVSEPDKILSSSIVTNMLDGIMATHAYKAQRPPKFVSTQAMLNIRAFTKYGNDPDKTWIVANDASKAVHYAQFPPLPVELPSLVERLDNQIKTMSGIDARYTGKDTGSILTTGGIEAMLAQATMRDTTKINNYEAYSKRLARLLVRYLIVFADKRSYTVVEKMSTKFKTVEIDFPNVEDDIQFQFALHISNHLPKSRMRMAQSADAIMEKSLQYADPTGQTPQLMTPEEWLEFQEFPQKDVMMARMKEQRDQSTAEEVTTTIMTFSQLLQNGMSPEQALAATVEVMENGDAAGAEGMGPMGSVGNEATADAGGFVGSAQARQRG